MGGLITYNQETRKEVIVILLSHVVCFTAFVEQTQCPTEQHTGKTHTHTHKIVRFLLRYSETRYLPYPDTSHPQPTPCW